MQNHGVDSLLACRAMSPPLGCESSQCWRSAESYRTKTPILWYGGPRRCDLHLCSAAVLIPRRLATSFSFNRLRVTGTLLVRVITDICIQLILQCETQALW